MLHPLQFGFRKQYSTETACCYLTEEIKSRLDGGGVVGAVFLDLRKAFDTVNHKVLINKLSQFCLHENTINGIQSYLCDRQQCVTVNNETSPLQVCSIGVPQGSILGPLLFTLYINDLPNSCNAKIIMYADDTVVYTHGDTVEEVAQKLTIEMRKVSNWLKNSCLTLNVEKTVSMFFTKSFKLQNCPKVMIEGQPIQNVEQYKYLGVSLDPNLNFKKHIKRLTNTLKFNLSTYRYIRNSLTTEASYVYLNAMILPHLRYYMTTWSQACVTTLKPLESLYKTLKIHDKKPRIYHHCKILTKHGILSFENCIRYSNLCLLFRIIHGTVAPPLKTFIPLCSEVSSRDTRTSLRGECYIRKLDSAFGRSAFSYVAMNQWNKLPTELLKCKHFNEFSRLLKRWLLLDQSCIH
uniref:Reverse transcriptase domain-containing protein n=1 Tax=Amphiprion percula TaxID=161767 RepID=A0A3P8TK54_AMPPE